MAKIKALQNLLVTFSLFVLFTGITKAQVLQHLPWSSGTSKSVYSMDNSNLPGFTGSCSNHHSSPITGKVDFGLGDQDMGLSAEDGKIVIKKSDCDENPECGDGWGNHVRIMHAADRYTLYAHFSQLEDTYEEGNEVPSGFSLGRAGSTGTATGVHLHFERWTCNSPSCATYPLFHEGVTQGFPNSGGRLVCGTYTSTNTNSSTTCGNQNVTIQNQNINSPYDCTGGDRINVFPQTNLKTNSGQIRLHIQ